MQYDMKSIYGVLNTIATMGSKINIFDRNM